MKGVAVEGDGMGSKQLLDTLADHMGLYHRSMKGPNASSSEGSVRHRVVEWMSGLSVEQRQATLTVVDRPWLAMLLQMQQRLQKEGAGFFFLLTDVPDSHSTGIIGRKSSKPQEMNGIMEHNEVRKTVSSKVQKSQKAKKRLAAQTTSNSRFCQGDTILPSLCFRRSKGLLGRLDEQQAAGETLIRSLELFSSRDGEVLDCGVEVLSPLDTMCVNEDLLKDFDRFLAVMDVITSGEFLTSTASVRNSSWEEVAWLKAMGYYSVPAFVANKIELAIWSAWVQAEGRRGCAKTLTGALAKDLRKAGRILKGCTSDQHNPSFASNVCRRNKGFIDWWNKLDGEVKSKAFESAVARVAKLEVMQLVKWAQVATETATKKQTLQASTPKHCKMHTSITERIYNSDSDSEQWSWEVQNVTESLPFVSGLKAIKQLSMLGLPLGSSEDEGGCKANNFVWASHNTLDSANKLSARMIRRIRNTFMKTMTDSVEIDLLGNENRLDKPLYSLARDGEAMGKKEKKRRKSRNSIPGKVQTKAADGINALSLDSSKLRNHLSQVATIEHQHADAESSTKQKITVVSEKHGKKKKRGRCKGKVAKENIFTTTQHEKIDSFDYLHKECERTETGIENCANTFVEDNSEGASVGFASLEPSCSNPEPEQGASLQNSESDLSVHRKESCFHHCTPHEHPLTPSSMHHTEAPLSGNENVANYIITKSPTEDLGKENNDLDRSVMSGGIILDWQLKTAALSSRSPEVGHAVEPCKEICIQLNDKDVQTVNCRKVAENSNVKGIADFPCTRRESTLTSNVSCSSFCSPPTSSYNWKKKGNLKTQPLHTQQSSTFGSSSSHEWPGSIQGCFFGAKSQFRPTATERLHLDVDRNWHQRLQASLVAVRTSSAGQQSGPGSVSKRNPKAPNNIMSLDWPPIYQAGYNFIQSLGYSLGFRDEHAFAPFTQPPGPSGFTGRESNGFGRIQDDIKLEDRTPEDTDYDDSNYFSGDFDDHEAHFISEEEAERQFTDSSQKLDADLNQIFGGGVMYWNTADYAGTGYSRPPSLSSEDSSWARHEADLSVVLDDIMGLSPISASFANVGATNLTGLKANSEDEQKGGSTRAGALGMLEGMAGEIVPRPVLRPIIVARDPSLARQLSTSESARQQGARSPHLPRGRRELPRWRRPPSPILRCVPPAPPPPPPSPVGGFRKRRGLTTVRSGSSSPRNWGLANWPNKEEHDGKDIHIKHEAPEVVGAVWRNRSITSTTSIHPISGALLRERLIAMPSLALEQDHPDAALPMQTEILLSSNPSLQSAITKLHAVLHEEIEGFCKQVAAENLLREPFINIAVKKVAHALQVLWPRSRLKIFGSNATGLALPCSDVDLVVCLPPVRNLEPIKEAGILEGRNGIKETCLQHAARYLADQDWVKSDSLKTIENTAIPIIMLVACVPSQHGNLNDGDTYGQYLKAHLKEADDEQMQAPAEANLPLVNSFENDEALTLSKQVNSPEECREPWGGKTDRELVRLDISFEAPSHTGLRTAELVRELTGQFPAIVPLALVLKQFLTDRSLDHPYTGGLSSYCLVLLITRFLQHQHHVGWPFQQNLGSLLMDFLHFFGCVFDPRQMGVCIRGGGKYVNRDRGHSIDPLHIEDPLYPSNNVGRNCFRILQCAKAFADAYACLEKELLEFADSSHLLTKGESFMLLQRILPSVAGL